MDIEAKLNEMGLVLPEVTAPIAAYVPAVRSGNLLFVAGQLPVRGGKLLATGKVPSQVSVENAKEAAGQCAINALAIVKQELGGDWSRLVRVVRVGAFVQSDDSFIEQATVANGASELLLAILGDIGRHARLSVGTNSLPRGASVEVEFIFEIR